jgi:hypothetical protein
MSEDEREAEVLEENPAEMIDGVICGKPAGTSKHASVIGRLYLLLGNYFMGNLCRPYLGYSVSEKTHEQIRFEAEFSSVLFEDLVVSLPDVFAPVL